MLIRQTIPWIAGAVLAVAAVYALMPDDKVEEARQAATTDLFAFVQALPQDAPNENRFTRTEMQSEGSAETATVATPEALAAADAFLTEETVRRMRAQGASDDEVYRARAAAMSAEKAAALARLDRDEEMWNRRVAAYQAQRNALDAYALQELRNRLFTAEEQEKLAAYEPSAVPILGMP
ncbi:MAG TPA: lipase secretion chaperone [Noviherbaspirillum sp.]|nr:lipase secretion chaperone [Noviherbaspirillum sp.]